MLADRGHMVGEGTVEDQRLRAGVVQQIDEFFVHVAVVDVERREAGLEGAHHRFKVFVAVVEVDAEVILAGLPILQPRPFGVQSQSRRGEMARQTPGAFGEFAVGEATIPKDNGFAFRNGLGDRLVDGGEIEVQEKSFGLLFRFWRVERHRLRLLPPDAR